MPPDDDVFPSIETAEQTWTVREVGERIQALLRSAFPQPFWMTGEASEWDRSRRKSPTGHWYFNLVDEHDDGKGRPSLNVKMWNRTVAKLFGPRGRLRKRLDPADGLVLRVLVRPDFWLPRGQVSFIIEDIDPDYTLGSLDRERQQVLARLTAEGALEWNKALELPAAPLDVGLVTSAGSAAHQDFMKTLESSRIGFRVAFCDARTQGADTTRSVRAALRTLGSMALDAIILVRGGGSRLDLSWFDKEDLARAVATCPLPVLTGIGHEIDTSVADAAAHTSFKTPTAVAEQLVDRGREARRVTEDSFRRIVERGRAALSDEGRALAGAAQTLRRDVELSIERSSSRLARLPLVLAERAEAALARARQSLVSRRQRLVAGTHVESLSRLEKRLATAASRLGPTALHALDLGEARLESADQRVRLLDPRAVLRRGYAYLRREDGELLMDAHASRDGEALVAVMRDGELELIAGAARAPAVGTEHEPPDTDRPASSPADDSPATRSDP